ncbi:MAG: hypothetical protein FJ276_00295 [Planctomycetes bacterium]|nr:hypothetical protein [Planctomycetota bacterium]
MAFVRLLSPSLAAVLLIAPCLALHAGDELSYEIKSVSLLDNEGAAWEDAVRSGAARVLTVSCTPKPQEGVKYPELNSGAPLYGYVAFSTGSALPAGARILTLPRLDATAKMGAVEKPVARAPEQPVVRGSEPSAISRHFFVLDQDAAAPGEPGGEASGPDQAGTTRDYDVLYFDANGDRDLTNDPKVRVAKSPPKGVAALAGAGRPITVFDCVEMPQTQPGAAPAQYLPWLDALAPGRAYMRFISTVMRSAEIRINDRPYEIVLAGGSSVPRGRAMLRNRDSGATIPVVLNALQHLDDAYFTLSVNAEGDRVSVSPYTGEFGQLQITARDANVQKLGVAGTVYKEDMSQFTLGDVHAEKPPRQHRLPVGKYRANLTVDCGNVRSSLSLASFGMEIRADKPFTLDFTSPPTVGFTSPAPGTKFRPGDTVMLKAMLTDASSGMMIRGLNDTTKALEQRAVRTLSGGSVSYPVYPSLVPMITITDSSGKQVAGGPMPFG